MKDFLSYLPLIAIAGVIGYVFFKELIIVAIIILLIIFRNEILGLCALAQIVAVVVGIPYLFFTNSSARNSMLILAFFFGGIFLFAHLLRKNEKSKENSNTDFAKTKSEQVYKIEELQNQFEKWLIAVENARTENKWKYGRDYERYVGYLFEREGFSVIYNGATKGSSDGGVLMVVLTYFVSKTALSILFSANDGKRKLTRKKLINSSERSQSSIVIVPLILFLYAILQLFLFSILQATTQIMQGGKRMM